jgi:hypothetical protein
MSDQCRNCLCRGNIEVCRAETDCSIKESWFVGELEKENARLRGALENILEELTFDGSKLHTG